MRRQFLTALLALSLSPLAHAQLVEAGGAKFEPTADVGGQKLVINGAGVRYRAIFKVYAAAFYLKEKTSSAEALVKMDGPKRVQIKMLRDVDGKTLGKAFTEGMEKNLHPDERAKTINGIFKFGQIFNEVKNAPSGSVIQVDWVPGAGALVSFDGKPAGEPIAEREFFNALLRIWVGDKPAEEDLKKALLGQKK